MITAIGDKEEGRSWRVWDNTAIDAFAHFWPTLRQVWTLDTPTVPVSARVITTIVGLWRNDFRMVTLAS